MTFVLVVIATQLNEGENMGLRDVYGVEKTGYLWKRGRSSTAVGSKGGESRSGTEVH